MRAFSVKSPAELPYPDKRKEAEQLASIRMKRRESESVKMLPFVSIASKTEDREKRREERKLKRQ